MSTIVFKIPNGGFLSLQTSSILENLEFCPQGIHDLPDILPFQLFLLEVHPNGHHLLNTSSHYCVYLQQDKI